MATLPLQISGRSRSKHFRGGKQGLLCLEETAFNLAIRDSGGNLLFKEEFSSLTSFERASNLLAVSLDSTVATRSTGDWVRAKASSIRRACSVRFEDDSSGVPKHNLLVSVLPKPTGTQPSLPTLA